MIRAAQLLPFFFVVLAFGSLFWEARPLYYLTGCIGIGAAIIELSKAQLRWAPVYLITALFLIGTFLGAITKPLGLSKLLFIPGSVAVGLALAKNPRLSLHLIRPLYLIFNLYLLFALLSGIPAGKILASKGANTVAAASLLAAAMIYAFRWSIDKTIPLWPGMFNLMICLGTQSRGGIATAITLMVFIFWFQPRLGVRTKTFIIGAIVSIFMVAILMWSDMPPLAKGYLIRFHTRGLMLDTRAVILKNYLDQLSLSEIFLGMDLQKEHLIRAYQLNPHNSYIDLHSTTGILGLACVGFMLVYSAVRALLGDFPSSLLLLLFVRSYVDTLFSFSYFDFIYFLLFATALNRGEKCPSLATTASAELGRPLPTSAET